jgi:3-hydroxyisobutyrate dehydrogenase-like beta-hydroxyacid dehydrogenase
VAPQDSEQFAKQVNEAGGEFVECPGVFVLVLLHFTFYVFFFTSLSFSVLGSTPSARSGTLNVMFGGSDEQLTKFRSLLECFGRVVKVPNAIRMKLVFNSMVIESTTMFAQTAALLEKQNLSVDIFMDIFRESMFYFKYAGLLERGKKKDGRADW